MKKFVLDIVNDKNAPKFGAISELLKDLHSEVEACVPFLYDREYDALIEALKLMDAILQSWIKEDPKNNDLIMMGKSGSHIWIHDIKQECRVCMIWLEEIKD